LIDISQYKAYKMKNLSFSIKGLSSPELGISASAKFQIWSCSNQEV